MQKFHRYKPDQAFRKTAGALLLLLFIACGDTSEDIGETRSALTFTLDGGSAIMLDDLECDPSIISSHRILVPDDCLSHHRNEFGTDGLVLTNFAGFESAIANSVALSDDRVIVGGTVTDVAGNSTAIVAAYLDNGQLDTTFGTDGIRMLPSITSFLALPQSVNHIEVGPEGVLYVAGNTGGIGMPRLGFIARISNNGQEVAVAGTGASRINALTVDEEGAIYIGGSQGHNAMLRKFSVLETEDIFFAQGASEVIPSAVRSSITDLQFVNGALYVLGKSVQAANPASFMAKLSKDGEPDPVFSGDGLLEASTFTPTSRNANRAMAVSPISNQITVIGEWQHESFFGITSYFKSNGAWSSDKIMSTTFPDSLGTRVFDVVIAGSEHTERIVGGTLKTGSGSRFFLSRHDLSGKLDTAYGHAGRIVSQFGPQGRAATAMVATDSGDVIVVGSALREEHGAARSFALARISPQLSLTDFMSLSNASLTKAPGMGAVLLDIEEVVSGARDIPIEIPVEGWETVPLTLESALSTIRNHVETETVIFKHSDTRAGVDVDTFEHFARVLYTVNYALLKAQNTLDSSMPMLQRARNIISVLRECEGQRHSPEFCESAPTEENIRWSVNLTLRDADRYLWGLTGSEQFAGETLQAIPRALALPFSSFYDFKKILTVGIDGHLFRSSDKPYSPVGGTPWFALGLRHSAEVQYGEREAIELLHHAPGVNSFRYRGTRCADIWNDDFDWRDCTLPELDLED